MNFTKENLRIEYIDNEYSIADCAKRLNVPISRVKKWIVKWDIPRRNKNDKTKHTLHKLENNANIGSKTKDYYAKIAKDGVIPDNEQKRREKIGIWSKNFERTEEHKSKIGKSLEGNTNCLGRVISQETRDKISASSRKGIQKKIKEGGFHWGMTGKNHSPESNLKNRLSVIKYIEKFKFNGQPLKPRIGANETEILDLLETQIGYKIKRQFPIAGYFLDGYIPELRLAIEIDEKHHFHDGQLTDKDVNRQKEIISLLNCEFIRIKD